MTLQSAGKGGRAQKVCRHVHIFIIIYEKIANLLVESGLKGIDV